MRKTCSNNLFITQNAAIVLVFLSVGSVGSTLFEWFSIDASSRRHWQNQKRRDRGEERPSSSSHRTCQRNFTLILVAPIPNVFELFGHDTMSKTHHKSKKIPFWELSVWAFGSRHLCNELIIRAHRVELTSLWNPLHFRCAYPKTTSEWASKWFLSLTFFYHFACLLTLALRCVSVHNERLSSDERWAKSNR